MYLTIKHIHWENLHLYNPASRLGLGKLGLIGRDRQILELERLLYEPQAGILIYGLAGFGKTALVRGFLRWLRDTGGLRTEDGSGSCPIVWFDFRDQFSASGLFRYLFSELISGETAQREEEMKHLLVEYMKQNKTFVIWDNFEFLHERMPEDEQVRVKDFLNCLQGGRTKVILTSRTKEDWLGTACARTAEYLPGLEGDGLWDFCKALADKYAYTLDPNDQDLRRLTDRLDGNPLSIRAVLSRLRECTPAKLYLKLEKAFERYPEVEGSGQLPAAFEVVRSAEGTEFKLILDFLGLHEHIADADYMEELLLSLLRIEPSPSDHLVLVQHIQSCFALLEQAGLCAPAGQNIFSIHPALRSCLAENFPAQERAKRVFVVGMCDFENRCHSDEVRRRKFCRYHEANLSSALELAGQLNMNKETLYLLSALAISASDRGDYRRAESLRLTTEKDCFKNA